MKLTLVSHWRLWWRRWSTWLAGLAGALVTTLIADPNALLALNAWVAGDKRALVAAGAGLLVASVPIVVTHICQPKLKEKIHGEGQ